MTSVMTCLLVFSIILGLGLPQAFALTRGWGLSLFLCPLITALNVSVAVFPMLVLGGDLLPWVAVVVLPQYAVSARLIRRPAQPMPHSGPADLFWASVPVVPPFIQVLAPPLGWDANSIWWLHALSFAQGGDSARQAIGDAALAFGHPDYPPLFSAPVALGWSIFDDYSLYLAQAISSLLTLSAIVLLVYAVRQVTSGAPVWLSRLVSAGVGLAVWSTANWTVASGMADPLWSSLFVASALLILLARDWLARPWLGTVLLAGTALSKNEAMIMAVAVACAATLKYRRKLTRCWIVWIPIAAGGAWMVLSRWYGATSDITSSADITGLLTADSRVLSRLAPTLRGMAGHVGLGVTIAVLVALVGLAQFRQRREALGLGSDLWLWALLGTYGGFLVATYLVSGNEIHWYLDTSLDRVCLPFALLACTSMACWVAVATSPHCGDGDPSPTESHHALVASSQRV